MEEQPAFIEYALERRKQYAIAKRCETDAGELIAMSESQLVKLRDHYRGRVKSRNDPDDLPDLGFIGIEMARQSFETSGAAPQLQDEQRVEKVPSL